MSSIQSVVFPASFRRHQILTFLHEHKLMPLKGIDIHQPNWKRVRIRSPEIYKSFITKVLPNGVHLIIGYRK